MIFIANLPRDFWFSLVPVILYGLILGSFATALIYRIPRDIPWAFPRRAGLGGSAMPRSACPHCGYVLRARDLVPVFSWLWLRGRCRSCRAPIGTLYLVVEMITALGCAGLYCAYGLSASSIFIMLTVPFLVALAVIDFQHYILPDSLNILIAALWFPVLGIKAAAGILSPEECTYVLLAGLAASALYAAMAWLMGAGMKKALKKDALGFGDVKFFAVAGLWLGAGLLPQFLMMAGAAGIGIGLIYRFVLKNQYFPFGPALIASYYSLLIIKGIEAAHKTPVLYFPFPILR